MNRTFLPACLLIAGVALHVCADPAPPTPWATTVAAGMNLARGNSETLALNLSLQAARNGPANEARLGCQGQYGESRTRDDAGAEQTETTVQNGKLFATFRWLLRERNYVAVGADLYHDRLADLDRRLTIGPSLGRYLVKSAAVQFALEGGVAYIDERQADLSEDRIALRTVQRLDHAISATSRLWEKVEYTPTANDLSQYLLETEAGIEADVNKRLALRFVFLNRHNSAPSPGKQETDSLLTGALSIRL